MPLYLAPPNSLILACSGADVPLTGPGSTSETVLATITIPPGKMGLNGCLRITTLWNYTNSANSKTPRVRFGGIGGAAYYGQTLTTTANAFNMCMIWNAGVANAQKGMASLGAVFGNTASGQVTSAVDTSAATTLVITGQLGLDSETLTLEAYTVELLLP